MISMYFAMMTFSSMSDRSLVRPSHPQVERVRHRSTPPTTNFGKRRCATVRVGFRRGETVVRQRWIWGGIALVALVGGCTSSPEEKPAPPASPPAWTEPAAYSYVLARGCDAAKPVGRYEVKVQAGAVADSSRLDAAPVEPSSSPGEDLGPATGDTGEEIEAFTLKDLLEMAQTAADDGGEVTKAFDTTDGHPTKVTIDVGSGPECWNVTDYAAAR
jgi:hypothetical protein